MIVRQGTRAKKITFRDRILIEHLIRDGMSYVGIGILLNKNWNSIGTEIRSSGYTRDSYSALSAQLRA